jgi:hypothetical protein
MALTESWFCLNTHHERIWLGPGEALPDRDSITEIHIDCCLDITDFHDAKLLPREIPLMRATVSIESCPRLHLGTKDNEE